MKISHLIIDPGHGSIDRNTGYDGEALTRKYTFPDGQVVYEGEFNRIIAKELVNHLPYDMTYEFTVDPDDTSDLSLSDRVNIANDYVIDPTYFLSIHCNASSSHKADGIEGFTSPGETGSDPIMNDILETFRYDSNYNLRSFGVTGQLDKEDYLYVLTKTKCRAGLIEVEFYDSCKGLSNLNNQYFIEDVCKKITQGIVTYNARYNI